MSLLQNSKGFQNFVIAVILLITAITFTLQGPPVLWQLWVHIPSLRCGFAVIFECVVNGFLNQPGEQSRTKCASSRQVFLRIKYIAYCDVTSNLRSRPRNSTFKKENRTPLEPQQKSLEWAWRGALSGAERQQNLIDYTEKEQDIL